MKKELTFTVLKVSNSYIINIFHNNKYIGSYSPHKLMEKELGLKHEVHALNSMGYKQIRYY